MAANLLYTADFLRDELQTYFHLIRRGGEDGAKAATRLRIALQKVDFFTHVFFLLLLVNIFQRLFCNFFK